MDVDFLKSDLKDAKYMKFDEIFKRIGSEKCDYIYKEEMRNFLFDHGIYLNERELRLLLSRYDVGENGRISYEEYIAELNPLLEQYYQRNSEERVPTKTKFDPYEYNDWVLHINL